MANNVKKPIYKKWWFWLIAAIIIIGIASNMGGEQEKVDEQTPTDQTTENNDAQTDENDNTDEDQEPTEDEQESEDEKVDETTDKDEQASEDEKSDLHSIGDSVESGDYIFTVNSVREDAGSEFLSPDEGNTYYLIDVTVENKGDESVTVSSLMMFTLIDSEGYTYDVTFGPETKGQLDGEVGAGRKLRGELVYEISKDVTGLELEIDPSLWSEGKIIFELDR